MSRRKCSFHWTLLSKMQRCKIHSISLSKANFWKEVMHISVKNVVSRFVLHLHFNFLQQKQYCECISQMHYKIYWDWFLRKLSHVSSTSLTGCSFCYILLLVSGRNMCSASSIHFVIVFSNAKILYTETTLQPVLLHKHSILGTCSCQKLCMCQNMNSWSTVCKLFCWMSFISIIKSLVG